MFSGLSSGGGLLGGGLASMFGSKDSAGLGRLSSVLTPDASKSNSFDTSMKTLDGQTKISDDEAAMASSSMDNMSMDAASSQTDAILSKLDEILQSIYGVRDATVEAGEGTSNRINGAKNEAIAQSVTYANDAISRNKPKPKELGPKPPAIDVKRPILA